MFLPLSTLGLLAKHAIFYILSVSADAVPTEMQSADGDQKPVLVNGGRIPWLAERIRRAGVMIEV